MRTNAHRGQALMELAVGIFALALVTSLLCLFVVYIAKSLEIQNQIRCRTAVYSAKVRVDAFVEEYVTGTDVLHVKEPHGPTDRTIP